MYYLVLQGAKDKLHKNIVRKTVIYNRFKTTCIKDNQGLFLFYCQTCYNWRLNLFLREVLAGKGGIPLSEKVECKFTYSEKFYTEKKNFTHGGHTS